MKAQAPLSPSARDKRASGSFTAIGSPILGGEAAHHPIMKMITGGMNIKETQLLGSSRCDGILFVNKTQLVSLNIPKKGFDLDEDPNELNEVIAGALGVTCSKAQPAYIELRDAVSDTYILCTKEEADVFPCSPKLPVGFFSDAEEPLPGAVKRPFPGDAYIVRVPRTMPRPIGSSIQ